MRNLYKILAGILCVLLVSCAKEPHQDPTITFAIFQAELNEPLTITPTVQYAGSNPSYRWTIDGEVVCEELSYTFVGTQAGSVYVTFEVFSDQGEARMEIRIDVCYATGSQTVLMYMIADNNLWGSLRGNINMAKEAVAAGLPEGVRVLVYYDGKVTYSQRKTTLSEIVRRNGEAVENVLIDYGTQDSTDPAVMQTVLQDAARFAPADTYGITLAAHGTGWFPPELINVMEQRMPGQQPAAVEHDLRRPDDALTRAFGPDGDRYMTVEALAKGLAGSSLDYVVFDACFMSSVETLYALRDVAPYIVASPAEIMGQGMPYQEILPILTNTKKIYRLEDRLAAVVNSFVSYYEGEAYPSAALVAVRTDKLPALAEAVKAVYEVAAEPTVDAIQPLEVIPTNHAFFDLEDYMRNVTEGGDAAVLAAFDAFDRALGEAIVAVDHTAEIWSALTASWGTMGEWFKADRVCGISSYIPREELPVTREAWLETEWARYVYPAQ